ncbi:glycosyltransferase family 2 protein, partial [Gilliamella sp. wkB171]|uniref:glycosyltransferase family 2 protein n=1 Tax=Gilliamella sp. wkB171 TaxID=3120258 RepID=UPI00117A87FB
LLMENKIPLVSIIIPVYNSSSFILKTLNSLQKQTYENYEIIIINDGSTDNTNDILEEYNKKNCNVTLYYQKNSGVSVARNKGIELSKGEFITFLDSDDIYLPSFLEKLVSKQIQTNADLVYCGYNRISDSGKLTVIPCSFKEGNILDSYLQKNGYFHFSSILIRKNILLKYSINFEAGCNLSEDLLFTVKLLSNFNCFSVKEHLFNYVQRVGSVMCSSWSDEKWIYDIQGRQKILNYLMDNYNKKDKQEIINLAMAWVVRREISYLIDCVRMMKYNQIKHYLSNSDFYNHAKNIDNSKLTKKDWKKYKIISKNNKAIWFFYTLYYRIFRLNLKIF